MQTKDFLLDLFEYNYQSNKDCLDLFEQTGQSSLPEKSIQLMNHILNAHQIWNERILGENIQCAVWEIRALEKLKAINEANLQKTKRLLSHTDLSKTMDYKTSIGIVFSNVVKDILFHIINHSTYHRGQIASDLKNNSIAPLNSDYIFYKRK